MTHRMFGNPIPDYAINRFENVRSSDIPEQIKAVGVDVDGVLRFYHDGWLNGRIEKALTEVAESKPTYIVANMYGRHEKYLPEMFKRVPLKGILTPSIVAMPGRKPQTARKPNPDMLRYIIEVEGIKPDELLMFDDQLSAGIEAAARIGSSSVLLPRLGKLDHPGVRVLRRGPERLARVAFNLPVSADDFPSRLMSLNDWRLQKNTEPTEENKAETEQGTSQAETPKDAE